MRLEKCITRLGKKIYCCTLSNTEQLGIIVEKCISKVAGVTFNTVREGMSIPKYMYMDIEKCTKGYIKSIEINQHIGNKNASADFITGMSKTVSVKTVMSNNNKICPQKVGQCTSRKFGECFGYSFMTMSVKEFIRDNLNRLLDTYLDNTFCCEHTILLKFGTGMCYCIDKYGRLSFSRGLKFELKNQVTEWNESNTVYITVNAHKFTLGEFQIHNNRDCIKFRFNTNTLLKLIETKHVRGMKTQMNCMKNGYKLSVRRKPEAVSTKEKKIVVTMPRRVKLHRRCKK
ncbi:hypothetical protein EB118_15335 [bacterium]|nr:hypothetical protein [bacterium]NDG31426.1 hypothetical protein [bacterium]